LLEKEYANGAYDAVLAELTQLRAAAHSEPDDSRTAIERNLQEICNTALKDKHIGVHDSLFEVGTSSLVLVEIHEGIEAAYPGKIDITDLFDHPTVADLAAHLESKLAQTL
jgi:acyl carrier protein